MRMWMINPKCLCNKHLLGEHGEIHKHRHNFTKCHSISGRLSPVVQIQPASMETRHNDLATEMIARGMNHKSPYTQPDISHLDSSQQNAQVDQRISYTDLVKRCPACRERILAT